MKNIKNKLFQTKIEILMSQESTYTGNINLIRIFKWEGLNTFFGRLGKKCFENSFIFPPPPLPNIKMYFRQLKIVLMIFIKL
jgi:hypothetical protein